MPQLIGEPPGRIAPLQELVNASEFEPMARRRLNSAAFEEIAAGDRRAFDRITFRPRMMVNTTKLDLTAILYGQRMFTPIMVAAAPLLQRFHPEGELAMARGASAAKATVVISDMSSQPLDRIAAAGKGDLWYEVNAGDRDAARERADKAVNAGCKAILLAASGYDWNAIDRFRKGLAVPVLLKGIMNPDEARTAVQKGIQGIVISNSVGRPVPGLAAPIEVLPGIADAVAGKVPILIDGEFRRGSDVLMALALGAQAVLIGRPVLWGIAAYGAEGVQRVIELIQSETARDMAMCGRVDLKALDRTMVKIHRAT